ncbi:MAG TPA: F0F1 ATP synthase subunit B [Galbitalea sp.]|jgi:F-type H+-transporting ATPase subunit b|nr:F0F1 ATP synthase subunit B [Galbitalea sp.]
MHHAFLAVAAANENPLLPTVPDLIWGGLAFILVGLVVWRVALPRLNSMIEARRDAIEGGIKRAEVAEAAAEAKKDEYEAALAEARAEAAKLRDQARADGVKIIAEAKEAASVEAARVTANAQLQIDAERTAALVSLRTEVGSLAIDLASGVIGESLTSDKRSKDIIDRFLADLEAPATAKSGKSNTSK